MISKIDDLKERLINEKLIRVELDGDYHAGTWKVIFDKRSFYPNVIGIYRDPKNPNNSFVCYMNDNTGKLMDLIRGSEEEICATAYRMIERTKGTGKNVFYAHILIAVIWILGVIAFITSLYT